MPRCEEAYRLTAAASLGTAVQGILEDWDFSVRDEQVLEIMNKLKKLPALVGTLSLETILEVVDRNCLLSTVDSHHFTQSRLEALHTELVYLQRIEVLKYWESKGWVELHAKRSEEDFVYCMRYIEDGSPVEEYWPKLLEMLRAVTLPAIA
ncbi:hypothetical protein LCGC14_0163530 [marine sediment metagenome]|uniref:Uncharacterized protein n=1 Tax=marine sediment metagenome TaxID=412755 RepID=A0A0F9UYA6_9ZZZZ